MSTADKVIIFLDGSNLFHGRKAYNRLNKTNLIIDYLKLFEHILKGRHLVRAIYYCSSPVPLTDPGQIKFLDYLRHIGVQVVIKPLKERTDPATQQSRFIEKGADVALAVDLLSMAWENVYDVAIVASGDGDYVSAVNKVMSKGKNVELVCFKGTLSPELREAGLRTTFIDDIAGVVGKS